MTLDVYNRAQFPPLIMLRAAFVVVAAASLGLYWVYIHAAFSYWDAQGGILGLQGIPLAVQVPIFLTVEGVAALTFWGASVYLLARRPNSKMVLLTAMVGFMMPVRVAFVQVIPLEALRRGIRPACRRPSSPCSRRCPTSSVPCSRMARCARLGSSGGCWRACPSSSTTPSTSSRSPQDSLCSST